MEKTVKCSICGKEFITRKSNKKYCSFVCKEASITKKRIAWKMNNPDYYRDYFRKRRSENA